MTLAASSWKSSWGAVWRHVGTQDEAKMEPRSAKIGLRSAKMGPGWAKMEPRWAKMGSKCGQEVEHGAKMGEDGPR